MSEIKNGVLDRYGAEPFEQQQFETAGVEGVKPKWVNNCPMLSPNLIYSVHATLKIRWENLHFHTGHFLSCTSTEWKHRNGRGYDQCPLPVVAVASFNLCIGLYNMPTTRYAAETVFEDTVAAGGPQVSMHR